MMRIRRMTEKKHDADTPHDRKKNMMRIRRMTEKKHDADTPHDRKKT